MPHGSADITVLGTIADIRVIAVGRRIRELRRLRRMYGGTRWRKLKGVADVRFISGVVRRAELHWYEAHGVGRRELKVKRILDD